MTDFTILLQNTKSCLQINMVLVVTTLLTRPFEAHTYILQDIWTKGLLPLQYLLIF